MNIMNIKATDINDAWFQAIWWLLDNGFSYEIQHGSYIGDKRLEADFAVIHITHPQTRPLEPKIPAHYGIPDPVEDGFVDKYISYLMTSEKKVGEDYTYGERLVAGCVLRENIDEYGRTLHGDYDVADYVNQIEHNIELLKNTPNTNQAIMQVGQPGDCLLVDPPCMRHVDMRIKDNKLIFYPYFRSWDLWGGFPANLPGLVLLQEYMAGQIGVEPGDFICSSKGLHLYKYVWELAKIRTGKI